MMAVDTEIVEDEPLFCDICGVEVDDPWHFSFRDQRHLHACDECWSNVRSDIFKE